MPAVNGNSASGTAAYDTTLEARKIFEQLINDDSLPLAQEVRSLVSKVKLDGIGGEPTIPTPWRETEAISSLKGIEAAIVLALGKLRYGVDQTADIDTDHATTFLFMSYLSTIDGYGKWDPKSVARLKRKCSL